MLSLIEDVLTLDSAHLLEQAGAASLEQGEGAPAPSEQAKQDKPSAEPAAEPQVG